MSRRREATIAARRLWRRPLAMLLSGALVLACTSATDPAADPSATPTIGSAPAAVDPSPSPSPSPSTPPLPQPDRSLRVDRLRDVHKAVVRLDVTGRDAYALPAGDLVRSGGSGFLIHSDGTAVTNAHVVGGATALRAHVNGDVAGVPARVVGFDPCLDIAVIRLEGSGHHWLRWSEHADDPQAAWAVGHPHLRADARRTRGRVYHVEKDDPNPRTDIPHHVVSSVPIKAGSSGSPLVDRDGAVIGVVYASVDGSPGALAASATDVDPAVTRIRQAVHPADIGVVGHAAVDPEHRTAGVWVGDLAAGSPAKRSGVRVGDMITHVDSVRVGQGGSLRSFCRALRDHTGPDGVQVEVTRGDNGRRYEGRLGDGKLRTIRGSAWRNLVAVRHRDAEVLDDGAQHLALLRE